MTVKPDPPIPHKRRTPCCEIEAFRYLEEHGYSESQRRDGLDVERLVRALGEFDITGYRRDPHGELLAADIAAEAIAAEYEKGET